MLQLFIAGFSSFLVVGLVNLYDPSQAEAQYRGNVAYVGPGGFADFLRANSTLRFVVTDQATGKSLFDQGRVDALIEELYDDPAQVRTVNLLMPQGELRTTLLVSLIKDNLKAYERQLRHERAPEIQTTVVYVDTPGRTSPYYAFAYALLVPLLLIVPVFLAGAIAADAITQELATGTMELLRASPAGPRQIFLGKTFAPIALSPLQGLLWIGLFDLNHIPISNPVALIVELVALTTIVVAASAFFALGLKKPGDAQIAYSLFVLLLFALGYLLPQPTLNTLARLAVGSLGNLEAASVLGTVLLAVLALVGGVMFVPRLLRKPT